VFELVNDKNKVLGRQTAALKGAWAFKFDLNSKKAVTFDYAENSFRVSERGQLRGVLEYDVSYQTVNFGAVNANDITDALTIRIASVNGVDPQTAAQSGGLQITALEAFPDDYIFSKGEITEYIGSGKNVIIPGTIWGDPVTSIGKRAFNIGYRRWTDVSPLTSVVIPGSVTSIGEEAFRNNELTNVTIGANVTSIGEGAFAQNQLTSVVIGADVLFGNRFGGLASGFEGYYNDNGRKAGTYTYTPDLWRGGYWKYSPARERR
jgi:hypothetical protein